LQLLVLSNKILKIGGAYPPFYWQGNLDKGPAQDPAKK
jgi:hypothetical protein